jgi:hypothetical protein
MLAQVGPQLPPVGRQVEGHAREVQGCPCQLLLLLLVVRRLVALLRIALQEGWMLSRGLGPLLLLLGLRLPLQLHQPALAQRRTALHPSLLLLLLCAQVAARVVLPQVQQQAGRR